MRTRSRIALALCLLGSAACIPARGEMTMREQLVPQLNRPSGPYEVTRAPARGQRLTTNPPVFVWLPVKGATEYVLQYSRDPQFRDGTTVTRRQVVHARRTRADLPWQGVREITYASPPATVCVLGKTLAAGEWHWRVGVVAEGAKDVVYGEAWAFTLAPEAVALPFPDVSKVIAKLGRSHPRVLVTSESLPGLRALGQGELHERLDSLKRDCDQYLGQPLLPEPQPLPTGDAWAPAYTKTFRTTRPFISGMEACAEAYLLSGEEKYGQEARRRLLDLVSWDPNGPTRLGHNDEVGTSIVRAGPLTYDYVYPLLTEAERASCRECFATRMEQVYLALQARPFEVNPFESHAMDYYIGDLTQACFAMAGDIDVREWLGYVLTMLWAPFYPPYGGADGGWSEGPSYWGWSTVGFMRSFRLAEQATGRPIYQREWARNCGYFKLYSNPPHAKLSPFGDGQSERAGGQETMWILGMTFRDPYLKWFADQRKYRPGGLDAFLFHDRPVEGKAPTDLPQARCFQDVGLAALHSDLAHGERDVQVLLRSSPAGTISHSYADQNAFTLDAFGEPLAIASGYYPYYGSPHHREWARQTKAANSITVSGEGQPWGDWEARGRVAHFESTGYAHYVLGEAGGAYAGRLTRFDRHLVYLRPLDAQMNPIVVIYDDLASPAPSTFQWWLHALDKMAVNEAAGAVTVTRNQAQLEVRFLTPAGLNFAQTDQFPAAPEGDAQRCPNQWHLSVGTTAPAPTARFLTVLLPHLVAQSEAPTLTRLEGDGYLGVEVRAWGRRHVIVFRTGATASGLEVAGLRLSGDVCAQSWAGDGAVLGQTAIVLGAR